MLLLLLLIVMVPVSPQSAEALMDFSRFAEAIGADIVLVDQNGVALEGRLTTMTVDTVTMQFASGERTFPKPSIASAQRLRDRTVDGLIKGLVAGLVLGLAPGGNTRSSFTASMVGICGAVGWALDAGNTNRSPIYQAAPTVKLSLRF